MQDTTLYAQILGVESPWRVTAVTPKLDEGEVVEAVTCAVRETLRFHEASLGVVRFHLWSAAEERQPRPEAIEYPGPTVRPSSPADYAALLSTTEVCRG